MQVVCWNVREDLWVLREINIKRLEELARQATRPSYFNQTLANLLGEAGDRWLGEKTEHAVRKKVSCWCVGSASREVPGGVKRVEANEGRQTTCVLAMRVVRARHNKKLTVSIPLPAGPGGYTRAPGSARPQLRPIPDGCRGRGGRREGEGGGGGRGGGGRGRRKGGERREKLKARSELFLPAPLIIVRRCNDH
ncbi:hypothetical protein E2C01_026321 [Portunus trituberculatus]|uniref:Uncharacterized protein n=1 Tax=Portunus trituberculatus TaxID=210409 RepID=A0A5B7EIU9_PORTR|nr:hypothetical protein [Portunus trituberculatus]